MSNFSELTFIALSFYFDLFSFLSFLLSFCVTFCKNVFSLLLSYPSLHPLFVLHFFLLEIQQASIYSLQPSFCFWFVGFLINPLFLFFCFFPQSFLSFFIITFPHFFPYRSYFYFLVNSSLFFHISSCLFYYISSHNSLYPFIILFNVLSFVKLLFLFHAFSLFILSLL